MRDQPFCFCLAGCSLLDVILVQGVACISEMYNSLEVITQRLSCSEQPHRSFQRFPEAAEQAQCNTMCLTGALRVLWGAPQCF